MVDRRASIGFFMAVAGLIMLCTALSKIDAFPAAQPWRKDRLHPVAALAWSQARCNSLMKLAPGTPTLQMDDVLEMSSEFDEIEERQGHATACANAEVLAASVAQTGTSGTSSQDVALARNAQSR